MTIEESLDRSFLPWSKRLIAKPFSRNLAYLLLVRALALFPHTNGILSPFLIQLLSINLTK